MWREEKEKKRLELKAKKEAERNDKERQKEIEKRMKVSSMGFNMEKKLVETYFFCLATNSFHFFL